ncbi:MAG: helix-turn-helix domain-containing protein [Lachnospiraceae bacterium]
MYSTETRVAPGSDYYVYTPSVTAHELLFYPLILGRFVYEPGYHLRRKNFGNFLLMLVEDGTMFVRTGREMEKAPKKSAVLLDCYAAQEYGTKDGASVLWIHFDGPMARPFYEHILQNLGCVSLPEGYDNIHSAIGEIYADFQKGKPTDEFEESRRLYSVLTSLLSMHDVRADSTTGVKRAISYISEHFDEPLRLGTLAEVACLSPYYFSRLFRRTTGMTPHQYVLETRIRSAKFLLSSTERSVKEIAVDTGFPDESSFCACFRAKTGNTPSDYRKSLALQDSSASGMPD